MKKEEKRIEDKAKIKRNLKIKEEEKKREEKKKEEVVRFIVCNYSMISTLLSRGCLRGVVAKVLDCDIVVSEFEFRSCYHVQFRTNSLGNYMKTLTTHFIIG